MVIMMVVNVMDIESSIKRMRLYMKVIGHLIKEKEKERVILMVLFVMMEIGKIMFLMEWVSYIIMKVI